MKRTVSEQALLKKITIIFLANIVSITLLDSIDLPSRILGESLLTLNYTSLLSLFSVITTIYLFCLGYLLVDRFQKERYLHLQQCAYESFLFMLDEADKFIKETDNSKFNEYAIPKVDFNAVRDPLLEYWCESPFLYDELVKNAILEGAIEGNDLKNYFSLKADFRSYIISRVVFYDQSFLYCDEEHKLKEDIKSMRQRYEEKLLNS